MDWANPIDPDKFIQFNSKNWVGSGNWVDMDFKNGKPIKNWVSVKNQTQHKKPCEPIAL
jgi:hypothetical protein